MAVIKDSVRHALAELPEIALRKLLRRKAKEAGFELPAKVAKAFAEHVMTGATGTHAGK